jgi:hypothetical protein
VPRCRLGLANPRPPSRDERARARASLRRPTRDWYPSVTLNGSATVLALDVDLDAIRAVIERGRARGDVVLLHTWLAADAATHIGQARKELGAG